jgi:septal ring factor EnvC (AmiA/AmiB activator)
MNKKGEDINSIIGGIFALFFLIIFFSAMIPVFHTLTGQDEKQGEINNLNEKIINLEQEINNKSIEISELNSLLNSFNSTIGEKDNLLSNLSGQLTEKEKQIEELSTELEKYKEKEYLPIINNNYYNILNYVEKIENKFYTINLTIGLISLTIVGIVIKLFGLDITIKLFLSKFKKNKLPSLDKDE